MESEEVIPENVCSLISLTNCYFAGCTLKIASTNFSGPNLTTSVAGNPVSASAAAIAASASVSDKSKQFNASPITFAGLIGAAIISYCAIIAGSEGNGTVYRATVSRDG